MKYYNFQKNWRRIKHQLNSPEVQYVLFHDLNLCPKVGGKFRMGDLPKNYETAFWLNNRRGRPPAYLDYVLHGSCHWLVNFNMKLATLVEPNQAWRILTSDKHSTVWDGKNTLFDMNYCGLRVAPAEAYRLANQEALKVGKFMSFIPKGLSVEKLKKAVPNYREPYPV